MSLHNDLFRILAVLAAEPATSGVILDRIEAVSPGDGPSMATFYRRLKEAVDEGWVRTVAGAEPDSASPGRPSRTFLITAAGLEVVGDEAARQRGFADLVLPRESLGG